MKIFDWILLTIASLNFILKIIGLVNFEGTMFANHPKVSSEVYNSAEKRIVMWSFIPLLIIAYRLWG